MEAKVHDQWIILPHLPVHVPHLTGLWPQPEATGARPDTEGPGIRSLPISR